MGAERDMRHRQFRRAFTLVELPAVSEGFTLVELLVVIGIISLLISVLLPSLNKARQQASLLSCKSNLHTIGELLQIYVSENNGYTPAAWNDINYVTLGDTLTLLTTKTYAPAPFAGQPAGANQYEPAQDGLIFRDVDTPDANWSPHADSYVANIRVFGAIVGTGPIWDPYKNLGNNGYKQRHLATIQRASSVMMVWCGAADISGGVNYGCYYNFPNGLDNYQMYSGHGLCYPSPAQTTYNTNWYANPISLGDPITTGAAPSSQIAGSVTPSYLKAANQDYTNSVFGGIGGFDANYMRFRHLQNTTCNFLFVDGHVESRLLGSVWATDVCLNPQ
jgi:prepilin-type N-terminal cleavage/methylation domain-containing protein/prepilin-type processing-associated H-X9-DG protein